MNQKYINILRARAENIGDSQQYISECTSISRQSVNKILKGANCSIDNLSAICKHLNCELIIVDRSQ